jgi:hypothetical protein
MSWQRCTLVVFVADIYFGPQADVAVHKPVLVVAT